MRLLPGLALAAALSLSLAARPQTRDEAYAGSKSFCTKRWSGMGGPERVRFVGEAPFMSLCTLACTRPTANETDDAFAQRSRRLCDARWRHLVKLDATTGWTRDGFIDACSRKCGAPPPKDGGPVFAGLAAATLLGPIAADQSRGPPKPASP